MSKIWMSVVAALSALALAGCGTSASPSPSSPASAAYVPLTDVSFHTAAKAAVTAKKSAHMTITMGSIGSGSGDVSAQPLQMQMTMHITANGKSVDMSMTVVDGGFYMQMPGLPAGKYLKVDSSTPGFGAMISALNNMTPAKALEIQQKSLVSLKYVGPEPIDGQATQHYTVVMDPLKALDTMGLPLPAEAKAKLPAQMTAEIYLNADNTPRRVVTEVPSIPGGTVQVDFTNWGEQVNVQAPPASAVVTHP